MLAFTFQPFLLVSAIPFTRFTQNRNTPLACMYSPIPSSGDIGRRPRFRTFSRSILATFKMPALFPQAEPLQAFFNDNGILAAYINASVLEFFQPSFHFVPQADHQTIHIKAEMLASLVLGSKVKISLHFSVQHGLRQHRIALLTGQRTASVHLGANCSKAFALVRSPSKGRKSHRCWARFLARKAKAPWA